MEVWGKEGSTTPVASRRFISDLGTIVLYSVDEAVFDIPEEHFGEEEEGRGVSEDPLRRST